MIEWLYAFFIGAVMVFMYLAGKISEKEKA